MCILIFLKKTFEEQYCQVGNLALNFFLKIVLLLFNAYTKPFYYLTFV